MSAGKRILGVSWRVGLCVVLLGWIFHSIFMKEGLRLWDGKSPAWEHLSRPEQWRVAWTLGPGHLWQSLRMVAPGSFVISLLFMGSTLLLGVWRWQMVLKVHGLPLSFRRGLGISFVAHFFNSFLLGSTGGDLIKAYYAARETHHKKTEAVMTVFVDRLIGLWSMLLFAGLMMIPNGRLLLAHKNLQPFILLILGMLGASTLLIFLAFWGGANSRFPRLRALLQRLPKGEVLERSIEACRHFGRERHFLWRATLVSMLLNGLCVLQFMALAHGMGLSIPPLALFVIVPVVICVSALPITPNGLGVRENLVVLFLTVPEIGISNTAALALSLLAYAGSLFWSLVGGVVYLSLKKSEHLSEVISASPAESAQAD